MNARSWILVLVLAAAPCLQGADALIDAAGRGDVAALTSTIAGGADINVRDEKGWTPLIHAIDAGHTEAALLLIRKGADIGAITKLGFGALGFAAGSGNPVLVKELLDRGARMDVKAGKLENTPFIQAVRSGSAKTVRHFLDHGADPNAPQNIEGATPLMIAADRGWNPIVEMLLAAGANIDHGNADGSTPLMAAAALKRVKTVELLVKKGANPNLVSDAGLTAFAWTEEPTAHPYEYFEVRELLYQAMTGRSRAQMLGDLRKAARAGDNKTVARISADSAVSPYEKSEVVRVAASAGNAEAARILLESKAGARLRDAAGFSPLLYAAIRGDSQMAGMLLDHGASKEPDAANREGLTPLMAAARVGSMDIVQRILGAGADPVLRDSRGRTALDFAIENGRVEIADALRKATPIVTTPRTAHAPKADRKTDETSLLPSNVTQKIALIPFSSDDNSYASAEAGKDLALVLQASERLGSLQWVERADLERARAELKLSLMNAGSLSDSLRVGKWLGADFVVVGRFALDSGEGRELTVEIVDTRSAEVLAKFSQVVKGPLGEPVRVDTRDAAAIADKLGDALGKAATVAARSKDAVTIAPLFFRNVSATGDRSDFLEEEIVEAFAQSDEPGTHVLRFSGVSPAAEERELALSGLVDRDDDAWKKVADVYVWGSFEEVESEGAPFDQIKVKVDFEVWDGAGETQKRSATFEMGRMATALPEMVRGLIRAHAKPASSADDGNSSRSVAQSLLRRVRELQALDTEYFEPGKRSQGWLRRLDYRVQLLELAHFFEPGDAEIDRNRLVEEWQEGRMGNRFTGETKANEFGTKWKQSDAWGAHVERFGLASLDAIPTDSATRRKFSHEVGSDHPYQSFYVDLAYEMVKQMWYHDTDEGFPGDVPPAVVSEWKQRFAQEYLRRFTFVAREAPQRFKRGLFDLFFPLPANDESLSLTEYPLVRSEILATAWRIGKDEEMDNAEVLRRGRLAVQSAMASAGREAETDRLMASFPGPRVRPPQPPPRNFDEDELKRKITARDAALLQPRPLAKGEVAVSFEAFSLPEKDDVHSVEICFLADGELWLSIRTYGERYTGEVWKFDMAGRRANPQPGLAVTRSQKITSLQSHGSELWVGTDGAGVFRFDPRAKVIRKYEARDGLPSPYMNCAATTKHEIFFGGGSEKAGRIGVFDFDRQSWANLGLADAGRPQIFQMAANDQWLAVLSRSPEELVRFCDLLDLRTRKWISVKIPQLTTMGRWPMLIGDAAGFWMCSGASLVRILPPGADRGATIEPVEAAFDREITALASDGDWLWVAAAVEKNMGDFYWECETRIYRVNKRSGKLAGFARVPYAAAIDSIAVGPEDLWLGLNTSHKAGSSLLRMPKAGFK